MNYPKREPGRRDRWKTRVLKTPTLTHGTRLFLVHTLSKHMKADGFVSRPRWKLAAEAGISERQVSRYIANAVTLGWLVTIQSGYRSMTAEYQASFPNPQSGTQNVPHSEPEKGEVNGPPLRGTNTSRIHAGKRDVVRPTTSSTTTRHSAKVLDRRRNLACRPHRSSLRFGFGMNELNATAKTPRRTVVRTVERHRTHGLVTAPVETHPSGTRPSPAFRLCPTQPRTKGAAMRAVPAEPVSQLGHHAAAGAIREQIRGRAS